MAELTLGFLGAAAFPASFLGGIFLIKFVVKIISGFQRGKIKIAFRKKGTQMNGTNNKIGFRENVRTTKNNKVNVRGKGYVVFS